MQSYYWSLFCFVHVEFCTNGMVFVMFGFFCRSGNLIEVSRWVKLCVSLCVTFGYVKVCYSMLKFLYVSSQGEEEDDGEALSLPRGGGGKWLLRAQDMGKVEIVSKPIHLFFFVRLIIAVTIFSFSGSNYDRQYYRKRFWALATDSSPTQRNTPMGCKTLGPCPNRVSDVVVKCHWYVGVVFVS